MVLPATAGDCTFQAVSVIMITFRYSPRMCDMIAAAEVTPLETLLSQKTEE